VALISRRRRGNVEEARYWVAGAREGLEQVRRRLLRPTPESFEASVPILESAIVALRQVEAMVASGTEPAQAPVRSEMGLLRRELARVTALAHQAAQIYRIRGQLLALDDTSVSNYTHAGTMGSPRIDRMVVIHG
jgi:hypothetical protein